LNSRNPIRMLYVHAASIDTIAPAAVQVLRMCQAFSNLGINVTLAAAIGDEKRTEEEYRNAVEDRMGIRPSFGIVSYKVHTIFGRFKLLGGYFSVKSVIENLEPDVVFLRNIVFVPAAIKNGTPFIYESHNANMHNDSKIISEFWTRYIVRNSSSRLMKKFIAISDALERYWLDRGIPDEKLMAVHDGFDEKCFTEQLDKSEARRILGLPPDRKIVLYMGSLHADRDIENIIDMAEKRMDVLFLVIGGAEKEKQHYVDIVNLRGLENIEFWGYVKHKDAPIYLYAADILLMIWSRKVKTIEYCSPLKLFEYMAAGRIIVGHGFTTIREVLTHNQNAFLVDPDLPEDLFDKLTLALNLMPEEFGKKSRQLAFGKYSWDKRAKLIVDAALCDL
jgi:glycosyltransferase involved in cell wall biosynthesis